jgi:hypothetical protein
VCSSDLATKPAANDAVPSTLQLTIAVCHMSASSIRAFPRSGAHPRALNEDMAISCRNDWPFLRDHEWMKSVKVDSKMKTFVERVEGYRS